MNDEAKARNRNRYLNVAHWLNLDRAQMEEAYHVQRGKVTGFYPCDRSLVFLAACCPPTGFRQDAYRRPVLADISNETAGEAVLLRAYMTDCPCHQGIKLDQLRTLEYKDRHDDGVQNLHKREE
ncbi:MAG: hypothetical protein JXA14_23015 [Anaerolineae bacterium]|nr:hypothetical protein [Anaerolineae bacterium]